MEPLPNQKTLHINKRSHSRKDHRQPRRSVFQYTNIHMDKMK